jgi:hypothetical protein
MMENSFLPHASGDAPPAQVISFLWMLMICQRGVAPTLENSGMLLEAYDVTSVFVRLQAQLLIHIFLFCFFG